MSLAEIFSRVEIIELAANALSLLILFLFSLDFFKNKTYHLQTAEHRTEGLSQGPEPLIPANPFMLTSKIRLWFWFLVFYVAMIIAWLILSELIAADEFDATGLPVYYAAFPQVTAVLLIAGVSTKMPLLGAWMSRFRDFAHTRASIPERAVSIFNKLRKNDLQVPDSWRTRTATFMGDSFFREDFFEAGQDSLESKWATLCYLFAWIHDRTMSASNVWSRNLANPELGYDRLEKYYREELSSAVSLILDPNKRSSAKDREQAGIAIDRTLYQVAQLLICLVFASTVRDSEADREFRSLGINIGEVPKGSLDVAVLIGSGTIISIPILLLFSVGILILGDTDASARSSSGSWIINSYITAVLVIGLPALLVVIVRDVVGYRWPVRSLYADMDVTKLGTSLPAGIAYGLLAFLAIDYLGYLGEPENFPTRLPFGLVSGGGALIAAYCLERRPLVFDWRNFIRRAAIAAGLGGATMVILASVAILLSSDDFTNIKPRVVMAVVFLACMLGALTAAWLSISLDYSNSFSSKRSLLRQEIDRYIVGAIGYQQVVGGPLENVQKIFRDIRVKIPSELKSELWEGGLLEYIDGDFELTEKGHEEIRLVATSSG